MSTQSEQNLNTATFRLHDGIPEHCGLTRDQFVMRDVSENAKTQHEMWSRRKSSAQKPKGRRHTHHLDQCTVATDQRDNDDGRDNDHLRSTNSRFSQTSRDARRQAVSFMAPDRFHSPTRSPASISPLGDHMTRPGQTTDGLD